MAAPLLRRHHRAGNPGLIAALRRNAYLTDERRLFRCLSWDGSQILLEDCLTLETFVFPEDELAAAEMRLVTPAAPAS